MKTGFSFSVLRYVHDIVGGEFVNIGVAVYSPDSQFLKCKIARRYSRISSAFFGFDHAAYRTYTDRLRARINSHGDEVQSGWLFTPDKLAEVLRFYLPEDDSAYQFGSIRSGITGDPERELERLYDRYVTKYIKPIQDAGRDEEEIWAAFRKKFPEKSLLSKLTPYTISTPDYEQVFEHSWKNERMHFAEPLSLDLQDPGSITDKVHRWVGRVKSLEESGVDFKIHFLIARPSDELLLAKAEKAEHILAKVGSMVELVHEDETDELITEIENDLTVASA